MQSDYFSLGCPQRRELFPAETRQSEDREDCVRVAVDVHDVEQSRPGSIAYSRLDQHEANGLLQQNFELKKKLVRMEVEAKRERAIMLQQFEELRSKMIRVEEKEKYVNNTQACINELIQTLGTEKVVSTRLKTADKSEFELSISKQIQSIDYGELQESARHRVLPRIRDAKSLIMSGNSISDKDSQFDGINRHKERYGLLEQVSSADRFRPITPQQQELSAFEEETASKLGVFGATPNSAQNDLKEISKVSYHQQTQNTNHQIQQTSTLSDSDEESKLTKKHMISLKRLESRQKKKPLHPLDINSISQIQNCQPLDQSATNATMIKESLDCEMWKTRKNAGQVHKIHMPANHLNLSLGASTDFDIVDRSRGVPESPNTFRGKHSDHSSFKKIGLVSSPKQPSGMSSALTPLNLSKVMSLGQNMDRMPDTPNMNSILKQALGIPNHLQEGQSRTSVQSSRQDHNSSKLNKSQLNTSTMSKSKQRVFYHGGDADSSRISSTTRSKKQTEHTLNEYDHQQDLPLPKQTQPGSSNLQLSGKSFLFKKLSPRTPKLSETSTNTGVLLNISKINIDFNTGKIGIRMQPAEIIRQQEPSRSNNSHMKPAGLNTSRVLGSRDVTLDFEPRPAGGKPSSLNRTAVMMNKSGSHSRLDKDTNHSQKSSNVIAGPKHSEMHGVSRIITVPTKFGDHRDSMCQPKVAKKLYSEDGGSSSRGIVKLNMTDIFQDGINIKGYLSTSRNRRNSETFENSQLQGTSKQAKPLGSLMIQPPVSKRKSSPFAGTQTDRTMQETAAFPESHTKKRGNMLSLHTFQQH